MFRKIILVTFLFVSGYSYSQNDGAGNTGLSFLKTGVGAREISMGEAVSSISDDGTAVYYNPARLFNGPNNSLTLMHNASVADYTIDYIGAKISWSKFAFGVGIHSASVSDIEIRTAPGAVIDKFNSRDLSIGLSLAYKLSENLSIGVTPKFLYEKIYVDESSGMAFDFGANYTKNNINMSFVVANVGSVNELKNEETKLPTYVRFGASYKTGKGNMSYLIGADGFKVMDGGIFHLHTGVEAGYKQIVFLRAGYQTQYENKSFTAGVGLKYKSLNFDYAFVPYKNEFGSSNSFSLGFTF
ncbi:MAG: PorV/PorQ family protein [Bacteroidetes bacterium]|nr:PorV/PorQ family protein [Bacteroidota bacterium]